MKICRGYAFGYGLLSTVCRRYGILRHVTSLQSHPTLDQTHSLSTSSTLNRRDTSKLARAVEAFWMKFGYSGYTQNPKSELEVAAQRIYTACDEYSDFPLLKEIFHLDDTFSCWADVIHLHMWMVSVRLVNHNSSHLNRDFEFVKKRFHHHMWTDLDKRSRKLATGSIRRKSMAILSGHYPVSVMAYDEGYFTDDKTLANALWKLMLHRSERVEPKELLLLVNYVHRNMKHLETIPNKQILDGFISFIPLDSERPNAENDLRIHSRLALIL